MNIDNQKEIENQKEIYLDANFLIFWFISKKPELKKQARLLFSKFLATKKKLYSSALTFDEAWYGIRKEYCFQKSVSLPYSDNLVFNKLKDFTNLILPKLNLIQLVDIRNGIIEAMNYIKTFGLRPRDAFHLTIMKHNGITTIATDDDHFIKKQKLMNIFVISTF